MVTLPPARAHALCSLSPAHWYAPPLDLRLVGVATLPFALARALLGPPREWTARGGVSHLPPAMQSRTAVRRRPAGEEQPVSVADVVWRRCRGGTGGAAAGAGLNVGRRCGVQLAP